MQPETIKLQGGTLALDFANSVDWTEDASPIEAEDALLEPDSLVRWGRRLGVLQAGEADAPELAAARALRPGLRAGLIGAAPGEAPRGAGLALVMRTYAAAAAAARLAARDDGAYVLD